MEFATIEIGYAHVEASHLHEEETGEQFDGVGTLLVDIIARMATYQSFHRCLHEEIPLGSLFALETEGGNGATASGTAYEDLTFIFRIKVDEVVAIHESIFHAHSTGELCLFIAGENTLYRAMLYVVAIQQCQFNGTSYTVVGT